MPPWVAGGGSTRWCCRRLACQNCNKRANTNNWSQQQQQIVHPSFLARPRPRPPGRLPEQHARCVLACTPLLPCTRPSCRPCSFGRRTPSAFPSVSVESTMCLARRPSTPKLPPKDLPMMPLAAAPAEPDHLQPDINENGSSIDHVAPHSAAVQSPLVAGRHTVGGGRDGVKARWP